MEKKDVLEALKRVKEQGPKRNFNQSIDLIIALRGLDLKKPEHQLDLFISLRYGRRRKVKVCALVGPELMEQAKKVCDHAISVDDFDVVAKDKKGLKKVAREYDYFIAQANIMPKVAASFGRILGPKGKMPNPKVGCVVPPNANLKPLIEKLQKTIRAMAKVNLMVPCFIGREDGKDEEMADNIMTIYDNVLHHLPNGQQNIRHVYLKLTMGKPVKAGEKVEEVKAVPKKENKVVEKKPEKKPKVEEQKKEATE